MAYRLRCPECRQAFPWEPLKPHPKHCPYCGEFIGLPERDEVAMPFISKRADKSPDAIYRAMEEGSEHRQQVAAEALGVPKAELSDMKITDMKDGLREGDTAVREVVNPVTQQMDAMRRQGLPVGFGVNGTTYSGQVQSGPFPNAGARTQNLIRSRHAQEWALPNAAVTSELPALETEAPGYRRRV